MLLNLVNGKQSTYYILMVKTGLEKLISSKSLQDSLKGNIALLCHSASISSDFIPAPSAFKKMFGDRFVKIFGPQHGFVSDVQDNMIETDHFVHPYFKIPVLSLYGETRVPSDEMLSGIDTLAIDLQDVGTRVYTYISTMIYILKKCENKNINIVILDRPNPVGGKIIEGNILEPELESFVGAIAIPMRHSLTMAEMALFAKDHFNLTTQLTIIGMDNWKRDMFFGETKLPWVNPSPNLPTIDGSIIFPGTVLYEGTNISEGRGTTRSLEVLGHPSIEPFKFYDYLKPILKESKLSGFEIRPHYFYPMFQKHKEKPCGGIQIHVTDPSSFLSWRTGQVLLQSFYHYLENKFEWNKKAYEYETEHLAIDYINGSQKLRNWVEKKESLETLIKLEAENMNNFKNQRENALLYT